ncbi:hypothetical protein lerEdw1_004007 [Lerista edwardsae]|nr:hypothetical protein lerEdw1_004007 [Lerista edwardsae]
MVVGSKPPSPFPSSYKKKIMPRDSKVVTSISRRLSPKAWNEIFYTFAYRKRRSTFLL